MATFQSVHRAVELDNGLRVLLVHKPGSSSTEKSREKESSEEPTSNDESSEDDELETSSDDSCETSISDDDETDCKKPRRRKRVTASVRKYTLLPSLLYSLTHTLSVTHSHMFT